MKLDLPSVPGRQMVPAQYLSTLITVTAGDFRSCVPRAAFSLVRWFITRFCPSQARRAKMKWLPDVQGSRGRHALEKLDPKQHFYQAAGALSEASLASRSWRSVALAGPLPYASIIFTIQDRGYVSQNNDVSMPKRWADNRYRASGLKSFPNLMDYSFTPRPLEESLAKWPQGGSDLEAGLDEFSTGISVSS